MRKLIGFFQRTIRPLEQPWKDFAAVPTQSVVANLLIQDAGGGSLYNIPGYSVER